MQRLGVGSALHLKMNQPVFAMPLLDSLDFLLQQPCMDSARLAPFVLSRLIALDKNPGVRPIDVGEVMRRNCCQSCIKGRTD